MYPYDAAISGARPSHRASTSPRTLNRLTPFSTAGSMESARKPHSRQVSPHETRSAAADSTTPAPRGVRIRRTHGSASLQVPLRKRLSHNTAMQTATN